MGSVFKRGDSKFWWVAFKDLDGKWRNVSSEETDEQQAKRFLKILERKVQAEFEAGITIDSGPMTVARYAERWIADRKKRGISSANDDETRLSHAIPMIGSLKLDEVRPKHIRDLVRDLMSATKKDEETGAKVARFAPRTIRHIYGVTRVMFNDAVADELLDISPCVLRERRRELPKKQDADPAWRKSAIYSRTEVERLISEPSLLLVRRVLYGSLFLTGMRISELVARRWRDYDAVVGPLGKLHVHSAYVLKIKREKPTKTGVTREVPVHPTLAKLWAAWRLHGWREWMGRDPEDNDLIIPSQMLPRANRVRFEGFFSSTVAWEWLRKDCAELGFAPRRVHDTRRTFISIGRADGASKDLLTWVSHGAEGDQVGDYTTFPWPELCAEVAKLRIQMLEGKLLSLTADEKRAGFRAGKPAQLSTVFLRHQKTE
jgi:integrase